jgi:hypothetical protein
MTKKFHSRVVFVLFQKNIIDCGWQFVEVVHQDSQIHHSMEKFSFFDFPSKGIKSLMERMF